MSKGSGMGQKRDGSRFNKGMDHCDATSHGKQCGKAKSVSKGNKKWTSSEIRINPFYSEIELDENDEIEIFEKDE